MYHDLPSGAFYRMTEADGTVRLTPIVPQHAKIFRQLIIRTAHEEAAHQVGSTYANIRAFHLLGGFKREVQNYIDTCITCQV